MLVTSKIYQRMFVDLINKCLFRWHALSTKTLGRKLLPKKKQNQNAFWGSSSPHNKKLYEGLLPIRFRSPPSKPWQGFKGSTKGMKVAEKKEISVPGDFVI